MGRPKRKPYGWESKIREEYGDKIGNRLVRYQKKFEKENRDNHCPHCGYQNEGLPLDYGKGKIKLTHETLFNQSDICLYCNRIKTLDSSSNKIEQ